MALLVSSLSRVIGYIHGTVRAVAELTAETATLRVVGSIPERKRQKIKKICMIYKELFQVCVLGRETYYRDPGT